MNAISISYGLFRYASVGFDVYHSWGLNGGAKKTAAQVYYDIFVNGLSEFDEILAHIETQVHLIEIVIQVRVKYRRIRYCTV